MKEFSGELTMSIEEGPYYKTGSPERTNIAEPGTSGEKLIIEGYVFDRNGNRIPNAWLDFWHADGNGVYDNTGYNLRGHQHTDETGHYYLVTIRPLEYGPRTSHVHVKVQANDNSPILTTQLFFPEHRKNQSDRLFNKSLVMDVVDTEDGKKATFNFVVDVE